jgi:FkbM family methyltransferase
VGHEDDTADVPLGDLKAQARLLRACLPADEEEALRRRRLITLAMAAGFERLVARLRPEVVLEIGAHDGTFSRRMKSALPHSDVIAIEANPEVHAKHKPHLEQAGVLYVPKCISASTGVVELRVPLKKGKAANTMGSILPDLRAKSIRTHIVEALPLDSLLEGRAGATNAIWLDVEGAIGEVLKGGTEVFGGCQVLYCELEAEQRWSGQALDEQMIAQLRTFDLRPMIRDIQRDWQYNAVFVKSDLIDRVEILQILKESFWQATSVE